MPALPRRLGPLVLLLALLVALPAAAAPSLELEVLDVGQGDALLLTSPAGKRILVDAGPPEADADLAAALSERGIASLDLMIVTHPHLDHVGGAVTAVRKAPPKLVLEPGVDHPIDAYEALLDELTKRSIPLKVAARGRTIDLGGGATALVLGPPEPRLSGTRSDVNANSVVLRVTYGDVALLLLGDSEPETERALLASGQALRADVVKVGHHGSRHSSTAQFLAAVKPRYAVISCGRLNDYGHPAKETLARLESVGAQVYRTDRDGTVRVVTDGKTVRVSGTGGGSAERPRLRERPLPAAPDYPRLRGADLAAEDRREGSRRGAGEDDGRPPEAEGDDDRDGAGGGNRPAPAGDDRAVRGAGGGDAAAVPAGPFVGSAKGSKYHRAGCPGTNRIKPANRVEYPTVEAAEGAGKQPASDCLGKPGRPRKAAGKRR